MVKAITKNWRVIHVILWLLWAIATVFFYGRNAETNFSLLFGKYFSYRFFHWFDLIFMFGGGLLLLVLMSGLLQEKLMYLGYIFFEMLFIGIIVIKWMVVLH